MIRGPAGRGRIDPIEPEVAQFQRIDEHIDRANRIALVNPIVEAFRQQRRLLAIRSLNEPLHHFPPTIQPENHSIGERFYTWGNSGLEPYSGSKNQLSRTRRGPPYGASQSWRGAMEHYVGLDVSLKMTAICIVDRTGKIEREGVVASDPEAIAKFVKMHAPHVVRIGLETGATSTWLWTELNKMGLPVTCIDARHAKAVLKMQINKSDRNDAVGIARIMQCGWYKEVRVKDLDSHAIKALLVSRALLVKIKRDMENQIRGLLKNLGLVIGRAKMNVFAARAAELAEARPELAAAVEPLLKARDAVERQVADLDRKVLRLARNNAQVRRFMTAPGVGPITALCFLATIDDPARFKRSRSVGAYAGLTTRRYASGEIDWTGRISKCGDKMLRSYLYEAANALLTRVAKWSALKAWGVRLAKRSGLRKAKVAVARKLAVILHRMWIDGTEFKWSSKEAANQPA
jgi:transposase